MQSSPLDETVVAAPRVSRLAIGALALVVVCPLALTLQLFIGSSSEIAIALLGVVSLALAHVAYVRIRRSDGMLSGAGYCIAAFVIGYGALALGVIGFALAAYVMSRLTG